MLKVMTREGNTLSPVIRSAWDCGDLKTMVKNSPAKATGAHISIVGHITRDELRRLLTQTESANGFANRFCWLAVKRSKCLPDGGAIHTVNFEDVVAELQAAVSFAKDFVEKGLFLNSRCRQLLRLILPLTTGSGAPLHWARHRRSPLSRSHRACEGCLWLKERID